MIPTVYRHSDTLCEIGVGGIQYYFSYDTLIAFEYDGWTTVRKNVWSKTTGQQLNMIDDGRKEFRLDAEEFNKRLSDTQDMEQVREDNS